MRQRSIFRFTLLTTLAATVAPTLTAAQQEDTAQPTAVFPEPFSRIGRVRELSGGRLLIADRLEQHVSFVDFASGRIDRIGREGQGPGEYSSPMDLFPLPDDGTLLVDIGNMRLTQIDRNGKFGESTSMIDNSGSFLMPAGTDGEGNLYDSEAGSVRVVRGGIQTPTTDSAAVRRHDRAAGHQDTVAMLKIPPRGAAQTVRLGGGGSFSGAGMPGPFQARDEWAVALDGRVAVARANPYRVDWYEDGHVTPGQPVDYQAIPIDRAEKEAWADARASQQGSFRTSGGGGQTMQIPRPDIDEVDFPNTKPPFERGAVRIAPDGTVWVERTQRHDADGSLYDVFDGRGRLVRRVRLEGRREIVGFGRDGFYATLTDDDDLQWLEKYSR